MWTRRGALCACGALLLASGRAAGVFARDRAAAAVSYCPTPEERQMLTLINDYRQTHGKHALMLSAALGAAAEFHSRYLANRSRIKGHNLTNGD
ncbi:MAG TPA: CAP domain-containing protein, partial [Thermomicrobiales bacterium]|nr:CAP domain-containing protein [Thermomicrobiales bacterium]